MTTREIENALRTMRDNDGLTLRAYTAKVYKTGYQVADTGVECRTAEEALEAVACYNGTCGIWYAGGIYYIDHSFRVKTKAEALAIGRAHKQISVLKWSDMSLVYC